MASLVWFSVDGVRYVAGRPDVLASEFPAGLTQRLPTRAAWMMISDLDARSDFKTLRQMLEVVHPGVSTDMSRGEIASTVNDLLFPVLAKNQGAPKLAIRKLIPQNVSRAGKDVNIWVIGAPDDHVGALTAGLATIGFQDYIRIESLNDMLKQILELLGPNDRILTLHITDHGYSYHSKEDKKSYGAAHGIQYVGKDYISSWGSYEKLSRSLAPIRERLAPGAQVILDGCTVGQADRLLAAVSKALGGTPVTGGTSYQQPIIPGFEGSIRTCMQTPDATSSTCWTDREASALGKLNYKFQENVVVPSIDAVRTGFGEFKEWIIEVTGGISD